MHSKHGYYNATLCRRCRKGAAASSGLTGCASAEGHYCFHPGHSQWHACCNRLPACLPAAASIAETAPSAAITAVPCAPPDNPHLLYLRVILCCCYKPPRVQLLLQRCHCLLAAAAPAAGPWAGKQELVAVVRHMASIGLGEVLQYLSEDAQGAGVNPTAAFAILAGGANSLLACSMSGTAQPSRKPATHSVLSTSYTPHTPLTHHCTHLPVTRAVTPGDGVPPAPPHFQDDL